MRQMERKSNTDFLAYSDTLDNRQKFHYKRSVTVTSHFYCKVVPIEAQKSVIVALLCHCNRCHCKRGSPIHPKGNLSGGGDSFSVETIALVAGKKCGWKKLFGISQGLCKN